ncbi:MAG: hypothetical protein WA979_01490 [Pacificimonas sp.]
MTEDEAKDLRAESARSAAFAKVALFLATMALALATFTLGLLLIRSG